jgi:hypothetical protein
MAFSRCTELSIPGQWVGKEMIWIGKYIFEWIGSMLIIKNLT